MTYLGYVEGLDPTWTGNMNFVELKGTGNQALLAAVPELSTWAMALLGFAALGAVGYRRSSALSAARA